MSSKILINRWDGGTAEDIRTTNNYQSEYSKNFDVFTNPHTLIPYPDSVAETVTGTTMDATQISDIDVSLIGTTYQLNGVGGATTPATFYTKSSLSSAFASVAAVSPGDLFVSGSAIVYKDKFYALGFVISGNDGIYTLYRYDSAGSPSAHGTITITNVTTGTPYLLIARPYIHPEDNKLYFIIGNTIAYFDGTNNLHTSISTSWDVNTIMPVNMQATAITAYGSYLAIAARPTRGNGSSRVYLWGRDASLNTFQSELDFGEGNLGVLENLDNNLFAVMQSQNSFGKLGFSTSASNKLTVKGYSGGAVQIITSIVVDSSLLSISARSVKNNNRMYFTLANDDAVYAFGRNKAGKYTLTKDRYLYNGAFTGGATFLSMIGDSFWAGFENLSAAYVLMRSSGAIASTYNNSSIYKTSINPSMPIGDRTLRKQLKAVKVFYTATTSGTIGVKYLADGFSSSGSTTMESIISESTTVAKQDYKEAFQLADSTSLASSIIEFQFQLESTGGVQITGFEYEYEPMI